MIWCVLTQVSETTTLVDEYVNPTVQILSLNTNIHGITLQTLQSRGIAFDIARQRLIDQLPSDAVLVSTLLF